MNGTGLYDSSQIANEFLEQAEQLVKDNDYDAAQAALEKAKNYAFNNSDLLTDIQSRYDLVNNARLEYIKQLEAEAVALFSQDRFDGKQARQVLQALLDQDEQSELAKSLWTELPVKEAAEREHRLVEEFREALEDIWQQARDLEEIGAGSRAVAEYERAVTEAQKMAGNNPETIPLQHLKSQATTRRDNAKEKWVGTPTLVLAQKGQDLVDRYEMLGAQGETETEFFDENGEFLGRLPIDECIDRAKKMASRFAEQKAQDYLGQAQELLTESPQAAYDKIQDALALAYPSDFAKSILEQELEEKIRPAMEQREKALAQLNLALNTEDPLAAWAILSQVEAIDRFTPGLEDAQQRLLPILEQQCSQLVNAGQKWQRLEDFDTARARFKEAIEIGQMVYAQGEAYQSLHSGAQEAFDACLEAEQAVIAFEEQLDHIDALSESDPEQAQEQLQKLADEVHSGYATAKIERIQTRIDFRLGVDELLKTLEHQMLAAGDGVELVAIEDSVRQGVFDYPDDDRFARLNERVLARKFFLQAAQLRGNPDQYFEAQELLQRVINEQGDDAAAAEEMLNEIAASEQQEAEISIAIHEASNALKDDDSRSAYLLLEPHRHAVSHQSEEIHRLFGTAATRWRNDIDRQLEEIVAGGGFSLPEIEFLMQELERCQSPRLDEWQVQALAPAYARTARDLQDLNRLDQAARLWEEAFRLAPGDPVIVEGRRNAQKHQGLIQAQMCPDPVEKEQLLNDLNRVYGDDPTVKRYLAEFYFAQDRYAEARLALSQVNFLSEYLTTPSSNRDKEAIRQLEAQIEEAEKIENRKLAIKNQISASSDLSELREARLTYRQLVADTPDRTEKLERWWTGLVNETTQQMKSQVAELSDVSGTVWARAELLCKILALKSDSTVQEQAERILKLTYSQLPAEIQSVVDNPEGLGYGPPSQALPNHIERAKELYKRTKTLSEIERFAVDFGISIQEHATDFNHTLYLLELTLEKLHFARKKQREIRNQIVAATMSGSWESIEDNLLELETNGLNQHRGLKDLAAEVERSKAKRSELAAAVEQINDAMSREAFRVVQDRMGYLLQEDPADEAQLQTNLEVLDPFSGLRLRGHREIGSRIAEKIAVLEKINSWQAAGKAAVSWPLIRSRMLSLANLGDFAPAITLGRAAVGPNNEHQAILDEETWSLGYACQYLENLPIMPDEINSNEAQQLCDQNQQKIETLTRQIAASELLVSELEQKEAEFSQLLSELTPLTQQLDESRDFLSSLLSPSNDVQELKSRILRLVERGRQLCPTYPGFTNFEERKSLKR